MASSVKSSNITKKLFRSRFLSILNVISLKTGAATSFTLYIPDRALLKSLNDIIAWSEIQKYGVTQINTTLPATDTKDQLIFFCDLRELNKPESAGLLPEQGVQHVIYCTWFSDKPGKIHQSDWQDDDTDAYEDPQEYILKDMYKLDDSTSFYQLLMPVYQLSNDRSDSKPTGCTAYITEDYKLYQGCALQKDQNKSETDDSTQLHQDKNMLDQTGLLQGINMILETHQIRKIGKVISVDGLNKNSENFMNLLVKKYKLQNEKSQKYQSSDEDVFMNSVDCNVIILDRSVDVVTPLLTELSYGGILNELDHSHFCELMTTTKDDYVWEELQKMNFGDIGFELNKKLKAYDYKTKIENKDNLKELSRILSKENIQMSELLKKHIDISSELLNQYKTSELDDLVEFEQDILSGIITDNVFLETLQEFIFNGVYKDFKRILKIYCLYSLIKKGIVDKDYDSLNRLIIDQYGSIPVLNYLIHLNDCNFLVKRTKYQSLKTMDELKTINNLARYMDVFNYIPPTPSTSSNTDTNNKDNEGLSFSYCGVVPLITRLVQYSFKISDVQPTLKLLNGINELIALQEVQSLPLSGTVPTSAVSTRTKTIIVVIGGLTISEYSTLQQLQKLKPNHEYIVLSNNIITGNDYISNNMVKTIM